MARPAVGVAVRPWPAQAHALTVFGKSGNKEDNKYANTAGMATSGDIGHGDVIDGGLEMVRIKLGILAAVYFKACAINTTARWYMGSLA